jgi:hypothetical protein
MSQDERRGRPPRLVAAAVLLVLAGAAAIVLGYAATRLVAFPIRLGTPPPRL